MIATTMAPVAPMASIPEPKSIKKKIAKGGKKGELATNAPIFLRVSPLLVFSTASLYWFYVSSAGSRRWP
jgi:hypothetical protein